MQAFLHTYDNLDLRVCRKFQPISMKSNRLNIDESILKSTPSWGVPFLYAAAFGCIAYFAPTSSSKKSLIIDPRGLMAITENYAFTLFMTIFWWFSMIMTIYLSYIIITRIVGHYFSKNGLS